MTYELQTQGLRGFLPRLNCGDRVLLSGTVYTSRDAAHRRIFDALDSGAPLPYPLEDAVIYYAGPSPAQGTMAVGSCGPTTAGRMDPFAPRLLDCGVAAMIGKGERSGAVIDAIVRNGAAYFAATGGAGALIAGHVSAAEVIAYDDLGCESVKKLQVERLPLIVAVDSRGNDLYRIGRERYRKP